MILCLGTTPTVQRSMIFDRLEIDGVNRAAEVREYASGKSPNVARVLRTLGADPLEVGFVGGDRGRFLAADMQAAGVRCAWVEVAVPTRLCTTVIDRANGTATELVEESSAVEPQGWQQIATLLEEQLPSSNVLVFSGSLPPGAPQDFYAKWVPLAVGQNAKLIIDARSEPLRLALKHPGFIAKLNRDELRETLGRDLQPPQALKDAVMQITPADGASIVTMGREGALACNGRTVWRVTPPKVEAISAVGSGDAFAAGLALELSLGKSLPEALPLAAACGAANALTALAGHVMPDDVRRLSALVRVEEI
jgi:tagatose 6-phosphate kinase